MLGIPRHLYVAGQSGLSCSPPLRAYPGAIMADSAVHQSGKGKQIGFAFA